MLILLERQSVGYDLVIRGGTVVTASDASQSDVGVKGGRIVALAESLPAGSGNRRIGAACFAGGHRQPCPPGSAERPGYCHGGRFRDRHEKRRRGRQHVGPLVRATGTRPFLARERL